MRINLWESVVALAIIVFAGSMTYVAKDYPLGTLGEMGPGYFPVMISLTTAATGVAILVGVSRSSTPAPNVSWRSTLLVIAAILAWALMAERVGLVPASVSLILLASFAWSPVRIVTALVTAVLVSAAAVVVFIHGFDLPLRALKW